MKDEYNFSDFDFESNIWGKWYEKRFTEEHNPECRPVQSIDLGRGVVKITIWVISKWPEFQIMASGDASKMSDREYVVLGILS